MEKALWGRLFLAKKEEENEEQSSKNFSGSVINNIYGNASRICKCIC